MRLAAALSALALTGLAASLASAQPRASRDPGFERPIEAGSWGGVVRNGPSTDAVRVAVLEEGDRVTLLFNTRVMRDGYPWFLIRLRDGRLGFQWGGILCRTDTAVDGVYQRCTR